MSDLTTTKENFVKDVNKIRLDNKEQWVFLTIYVQGLDTPIQYKSFNNWIQILRFNGLSYPTSMGNTASQFKEELQEFINRI